VQNSNLKINLKVEMSSLSSAKDEGAKKDEKKKKLVNEKKKLGQ
jgi:hypothetical protein